MGGSPVPLSPLTAPASFSRFSFRSTLTYFFDPFFSCLASIARFQLALLYKQEPTGIVCPARSIFARKAAPYPLPGDPTGKINLLPSLIESTAKISNFTDSEAAWRAAASQSTVENEVDTMIAIKTLIGGSVLVMAVGALPMMAYAGDSGDDYHHGGGMENYHHGHGEMGYHHDHGDMGDFMHGGKGHIMRGHLRVDVYIHKAGEEKHKKHEGEHMKSHWEHAHHGGWDHEKFSKMHGHHGDWEHSRYGYEGHGGRDYDHYDKAFERHGHWDAEQYGDESGGDRGDYPDDGGGD